MWEAVISIIGNTNEQIVPMARDAVSPTEVLSEARINPWWIA